MSSTRELAEMAVGASWESFPESTQARAKLALVDAIACGVAGSACDTSAALRSALGLPGPREAVLLGGDGGTTTLMAAFYNAAAVNALDYDDQAPSGGHPGAAVVPAALACAEKLGSSGEQLLAALVVGYEVAMRVQAAIRPSPEQYARAHGNGTPLAFGAAAAAGKLLGLDEQGMRRAFGVAGPLSPVPHAGKFGWDEATLSWVKDNVPWPAEAGLRAALLAAAGFVASESIFDGDTGFWRMAASDRLNKSELAGHDHWLLESLAFKTYPCCRWLHPILDAVEELQRAHELAPGEVAQVDIASTAGLAERFGKQAPKSMVDAQFSAPHAVAMKLLDSDHSTWWRHENREGDLVLDLMRRVVIAEDSQLTRRHEELKRGSNRVPARVSVRLRSGKELSAYCDHASGSPDHPTSQTDHLAGKTRMLLGTAFSAERAEEIIHAADSLDRAADLSNLLQALDLQPQPPTDTIPMSRPKGIA
jgi:2-methylcitrate dehydratase PrpD